MTAPAVAPSAPRSSQLFGRRRVAKARVAVSSIFFQQGLLVGGWALHIPLVLDRLAISEATMGLVIVVFGMGSILAMLALGPVIERFGSRPATRLAAVATSFFLPAVMAAPDVVSLAVVAFAVGAAIGAIDVAMNAQAVEVERRRARPIMSSFHAYWSMGTLIGAGTSGAIIAVIGPMVHAILFTAIALVIAATAWAPLVRERMGATGERKPFRLPRSARVWVLGVVCLFAYVPAGAAID